MSDKIEIITLPPRSSLIAPLVSPFAMHPGVKADMRLSPTKTWWVAIIDGEPVGLVAAEIRARDVAHFQHAFVLPDHRRKGVYSALFMARDEWACARSCSAVVSPDLVRCFDASGFAAVRRKGKYTVMERGSDDT